MIVNALDNRIDKSSNNILVRKCSSDTPTPQGFHPCTKEDLGTKTQIINFKGALNIKGSQGGNPAEAITDWQTN